MELSAKLDLTPPVDEKGHHRGAVSARVTLVEYGDFECPDTVGAYPFVKAILRAHGDQVQFVYRHYPLTRIHDRAKPAAEAAEAAGSQGKFWEFHDRLFGLPYQLERRQLVAHARAVGLDVERFERDLADPQHGARVLADLDSGDLSGVPGTPTFFMNGKRYEGPEDWAVLTAAVEAALHD